MIKSAETRESSSRIGCRGSYYDLIEVGTAFALSCQRAGVCFL
jgi:hypothetical protein